MLKYGKLLISTGILCLGLAGCGTSGKEDSSDNKAVSEPKAEQSSGTASQPAKDSSTEKAPAPSADQSTVRVMEQNLKYTFNGAEKEETAFLKKSDKGYSLYILPEFELTPEEPVSDMVYLKKDDSVFMRIELLNADADLAGEEEIIKAQLSAVSKTIVTPKQPELTFQNGVTFEASTKDENVTSILVKDEKNPLKITMFTKTGADYRPAFMEMAKTIMKEAKK